MNDLLNPTAWAVLSLVLSAVVLAGLTILQRRREMPVHIREIAAFRDLRDELGRAAESGKPLHIALGSGAVGTVDTISSLAGLQALEGLVDAAVSYDAAPVITVGDPTLVPLAQDVLRRAYERREVPKLYRPSQVRLVAPSSLTYGAGALPVGAPEDVTASVMMGSFGAEASFIAEASNRRGAPNIAAVDAAPGIGALYVATDRLAVGEELYAVGAQLTKQEKLVNSLIAEDILRGLLALAIVGAAILALVGI
ncbi:MAG: hypothetical protein PVJ55_06490 [Anaerolineae bacterium]|jgi:hypothetical protein